MQQVQFQASQMYHAVAHAIVHLLAGCGEASMLLACGLEPRGCLRLAHKAAALSPVISQGPHMPVRSQCLQTSPPLFAVFLMLIHHYQPHLLTCHICQCSLLKQHGLTVRGNPVCFYLGMLCQCEAASCQSMQSILRADAWPPIFELQSASCYLPAHLASIIAVCLQCCQIPGPC